MIFLPFGPIRYGSSVELAGDVFPELGAGGSRVSSRRFLWCRYCPIGDESEMPPSNNPCIDMAEVGDVGPYWYMLWEAAAAS